MITTQGFGVGSLVSQGFGMGGGEAPLAGDHRGLYLPIQGDMEEVLPTWSNSIIAVRLGHMRSVLIYRKV